MSRRLGGGGIGKAWEKGGQGEKGRGEVVKWNNSGTSLGRCITHSYRNNTAISRW